MEISGKINRLLIIATVGLIFTTFFVSASPKIRSDRKGSSDTNDISEERNTPFVSCYESIPCGWALYTTERRQPFRRISSYTRNRLCECNQNYNCVLTDNWQDRRAYVFHCRHRETSSHMFPFPDRKWKKNFQKKKKKPIKRAMDKKWKEKNSQRALKQKVSDLTVCFSSFTNEVYISQRNQTSFKIKIYIILKMIRNRSEP